MQNKVAIGTSKSEKATIADLPIGQLFYWESPVYGELVGIRTVNPGKGALGILLYEGTYLTGDCEVVPLAEGTVVTITAGSR